jgi:hypothetical protein
LGSVDASDIVIPHQEGLHEFDGKAAGHRLQFLRHLGDELELFLSHGVVILPEIVIVLVQFLSHEITVGETSLVGGTPHSNEGEILILISGMVDILFSELMAFYFGEGSIDGGVGIDLTLTAGRTGRE